MAEMLKVSDLHVYYGSIHAVKGVSFEVHEGEVVTLIGANGAELMASDRVQKAYLGG